jgi:hypothetical protein
MNIEKGCKICKNMYKKEIVFNNIEISWNTE